MPLPATIQFISPGRIACSTTVASRWVISPVKRKVAVARRR
jgi:hypothetical protein